MIKCFSFNGEFYKEGKIIYSFEEIYESLRGNEKYIAPIPVDAMVALIDAYGKAISKDKSLLKEEGVPFLSFYLKKNNLYNIIDLNIKNKSFLDKFIEVEDKKYIKAQKRGLVCHWIAANVPTLGIYSIFQSILCRNSNLVKVPEESINILIKLLKPIREIKINFGGVEYLGIDILKNICIVNFSSSSIESNTEMSKMADCRVFWGGEEGLRVIRKLPQKTTCKDIIFGPKYSFAVFEKEVLESSDLEKHLESLALDIIAFNQRACSSPHVLFIEKSSLTIEEVCNKFINIFKKFMKRYHENYINTGVTSSIVNIRGEYALDLNKMLYCSQDLQYTILLNNDFKLEEPIGGRTIFMKEVNEVFEIEKLITPRIQTVGIAFKSKERAIKLAEALTNLGVDRIVKVGYMSLYDNPWDGTFPLNELVRWCSLNINGMIENEG